MTLSRSVSALCVLVTLFACGDGSHPASSVSVTEADGVLHVELPSLDAVEALDLSVETLYTTGGDVDLFQVTGARFVQDGLLAIANSGNGEILLIDDAGNLQRRIGRRGEGPGEFAWIAGFDVGVSGELVVYDPRLARLTRLRADGSVSEVIRLAPPNRVIDLEVLTILNNGSIAAVYGARRTFAQSGERRDTIPLMLFDREGSSPDTIGMWPATEWAFASFAGVAARGEVGFGRTAAYAGRTGRFAIGSTDTIEISVFDEDGRLVMRVAGGEAVAVAETDIQLWRQDLLERRSQAPDELRRAFDEFPHRSSFPGFQDLAVDDAGRIWIGSYPRPRQSERAWLVIDSNGHAWGNLMLPVSARVLDVAGDRIAIIWRNELDEEFLSVLRIVS